MGSKNLETARREGVAAGRDDAIRKLRAFIGIPGLVQPDLHLPEHLAYPAYERALVELLEERRVALGEWQHEADEHAELARASQVEAAATVRRRREERTDRNALVRAAGAVSDRFVPAHRDAKRHTLNRDDALLQVEQSEHEWIRLGQELHRVHAWLDEMYQAVIDDREAAQAERDAASRDVSPRHCIVMTLEHFLEADTARRFDDELIHMIGGREYGSKWRSDVTPDALWRLHWIKATGESVLENGMTDEIWLLGNAVHSRKEADAVFATIQSRQGERNSLALVLDAYEAAEQRPRVSAQSAELA